MKLLTLVLAGFQMLSSNASASESPIGKMMVMDRCTYSDNLPTPEKPNGSLLTFSIEAEGNFATQYGLVTLDESSGLMRAAVMVDLTNGTKTFSVRDRNDRVLNVRTTTLASSVNILLSVNAGQGRKAIVSLICVPRL